VGYFDNLEKFFCKKTNKILVAVSVILTVISCLVFYFFRNTYQKSLNEQLLHRQQISSRAGALAVEAFVDSVGDTLSLYSKEKISISGYMALWKDHPVGGITLINVNGKVIDNFNNENIKSVGEDLSDRDYFIKLKENPNLTYTISSPVLSKVGLYEGKYIIVVASPVLENGKFNGVLASSIVISDLAKKYLYPLKISEETRVCLVDKKGTIIFINEDEFLGKNYMEYIKRYNTDESAVYDFFEYVASNETEGKISLFLPRLSDFTPSEYLSSVAPIKYKDHNVWFISISTPVKEAMWFAHPFNNYSFFAIVFAICTILGFSAVCMVIIKMTRTDAYAEGYNNGKRAGRNIKK